MTQRELVVAHVVDGSRPQHRQGVGVAALVHEQAGQDEHGNAAAFVAGNGSAGQERLRLRRAALPHIQAPKRMIEKWAIRIHVRQLPELGAALLETIDGQQEVREGEA